MLLGSFWDGQLSTYVCLVAVGNHLQQLLWWVFLKRNGSL